MIKEQVKILLEARDRDGLLELAARDRRVTSAINRLLYHPEATVRWRAVEAMGWLAAEDPYGLENIIGRLVYTMNDDSGSIGWTSPQALGEICAQAPDIVEDFFPIVVSSIGIPAFTPGVIWAVGRVAPVRPDLVEGAGEAILPHATNPDPEIRGLACRTLGILKWRPARDIIAARCNDNALLTIYHEGRMRETTVGALAAEALADLEHDH